MQKASPAQVITGLRTKALTEAPALLLRNPAFRQEPALVVLMETGHAAAVATLVAMIDGGASLYFSSGGGVIGGENLPVVRIAGRRFTQFAGVHLRDMSACTDFPMPALGQTVFYVVTPNGIFTQSAPDQDLRTGGHSFSPLFHAGHYVIGSLRAASEKNASGSVPPRTR